MTQGGPFVEVFSAQGRNPAAEWKQNGTIRLEYDKEVKSNVYVLEGGPTLTKMSLPRDEKHCRKLPRNPRPPTRRKRLLARVMSEARPFVCLPICLSVILLFISTPTLFCSISGSCPAVYRVPAVC